MQPSEPPWRKPFGSRWGFDSLALPTFKGHYRMRLSGHIFNGDNPEGVRAALVADGDVLAWGEPVRTKR